jgi:hypothetical protein
MGTGFFLENIQTAIGNKDQGLFQKKKHYGHRYQWRLGFKKNSLPQHPGCKLNFIVLFSKIEKIHLYAFKINVDLCGGSSRLDAIVLTGAISKKYRKI